MKFRDKIYLLLKKYGAKLGLDLPYLVKNGFWMSLRLVVNTILALALYVFFTHFVSQEVFGQYQFIISIFAIVYIFSHPGLNTSLLRSVSRGDDGDYIPAVRRSFQTSLWGVPILLFLGAYYYFADQKIIGASIMISSVFFPFFYAPNTWEWFLQGKHKFNILVRYSVIQSFFNVLATVLIIFLKPNSLIWIILTYLISYTFFNILYYWKSLKYIENAKKDSEFWTYGWFLTKINILVVIANNIDKILVGIFLGPVNLAIYTVTTFLVIRVKDASRSLTSMFFPKMATLKINFAEFLKIHRIKVVVLTVVLLAASILYYLAIPFLNQWMFTEKYAHYSYISQIFSLTFFLAIPISILGYYVSAKKNEYAIVLTNPVFSLIKIVLNVYFIWKYQLLGAAIAFNLSMLLWLILHVYGILHEEKMQPDFLES